MNLCFFLYLSAILGIIAFLPPQFIGASLALGGPINFYPASFVFLAPLFVFFAREDKFWRLILGAAIFRLIFGLGTVYYTNDYAGVILPDGEARLTEYENSPENWGLFVGEIRY